MSTDVYRTKRYHNLSVQADIGRNRGTDQSSLEILKTCSQHVGSLLDSAATAEPDVMPGDTRKTFKGMNTSICV